MRKSCAWTFAVVLIVSIGAHVDADSFNSNGVTINYIEKGRGEPVVLIHGFAVGAAMWMGPPAAGTALLPALAGEYRVVALDLRGHGASGKPNDSTQYGDEMVRDVVRLLDHLEIGKAHVVGYSMGAVIAGKLLVTQPDRLLSVTFGGGGPMVGPPTALDETLDATADSLASGNGLSPLVMSFTPPGHPQPNPEQVAAINARLLANQDPQALAAVLRSRTAWRVSEDQLKASRVPACIVYGSEEGENKQWITASSKLLPHAGVRVIEGGDHLDTPARPEFVAAVQECLRAAQ
jgi:pimeloyl-ACP methyl ester carboxylesterase